MLEIEMILGIVSIVVTIISIIVTTINTIQATKKINIKKATRPAKVKLLI